MTNLKFNSPSRAPMLRIEFTLDDPEPPKGWRRYRHMQVHDPIPPGTYKGKITSVEFGKRRKSKWPKHG